MKGPVALDLGENCDFYSKGNQYAVRGSENGSDTAISVFLKEHSGLSEKKPEKVKQVWLADSAPHTGERREGQLSLVQGRDGGAWTRVVAVGLKNTERIRCN